MIQEGSLLYKYLRCHSEEEWKMRVQLMGYLPFNIAAQRKLRQESIFLEVIFRKLASLLCEISDESIEL